MVTRFAVGFVAVPVFVFAWGMFLQSPSRMAALTPVESVDVWHEDLGSVVFSSDTQEVIAKSPPEWDKITWTPTQLPNVKELGVAVDLPPTAPKRKVWVRIRLPEQQEGRGRLGLLGYRVIAHGPWSVWVNQRLVQTNLVDWTMQLNVPLRVSVPLDAKEVLLAVPYVEPVGYAIGSMFFGPMDVVDSAWAERNVWHMEASRFLAVAGLLLMVVSFHLAWSRPQEPIFWLLGLNALAWSAACLQYIFGISEDSMRDIWFDFAVDTSTSWTVVLAVIFALDFEGVCAPRVRAGLVLYAATSTVLVMPLWQWEQSALLIFHYFNVAAMLVGLSVLAWHVVRNPRREGVLMVIVLLSLLVMGIYSLKTLTNYSKPDEVFLYPIGIVVLYLTFSYVMNRRTVAALNESEAHESTLHQRLKAQEAMLATQHARLQQMEVERSLALQRNSIMQDLHDRVGGNLTTALLQARTGKLTGEDALLVLQELAEEVRHIAKREPSSHSSLSQLLTEMRRRFEPRLGHAGIALEWQVDPSLYSAYVPSGDQHLRALLSEAIANVVKHSGAAHIVVKATLLGKERVRISIEDNGAGFSSSSVVEGRGLPGMRLRAEAMSGRLAVSASEVGGTRIELEVPVSMETTRQEQAISPRTFS